MRQKELTSSQCICVGIPSLSGRPSWWVCPGLPWLPPVPSVWPCTPPLLRTHSSRHHFVFERPLLSATHDNAALRCRPKQPENTQKMKNCSLSIYEACNEIEQQAHSSFFLVNDQSIVKRDSCICCHRHPIFTKSCYLKCVERLKCESHFQLHWKK